jgi:hypothetical protein
VQAQVHSDGRYAFIELRTAEYATAALQLDGQINLMGSALSIGRPAAYIDPDKVCSGMKWNGCVFVGGGLLCVVCMCVIALVLWCLRGSCYCFARIMLPFASIMLLH